MNKNIIPIAIIVAGVLIAGAVVYLGYSNFFQSKEKAATGTKILSSQEAGEKVINFINQSILKGNASASLNEILEENGMYKIKFTVEEQEIEAYITLDGKFLFSKESAIDLEPPLAKDIPKTVLPEVKLFVMSFCSYGNEAEEIMTPVVELLKNKANIRVHYIVSKLSEEEYSSLHGEQELHQDIREICVNKYQPEKFWQFLKEINENCGAQDADSKWQQIADNIGVNIQKIKDCQEQEGRDLLAQEIKLTEAKYLVQDPNRHQSQEEITISGSPTLVINGMIYDGERSSEGYKNGICSAFENLPEECNKDLNNASESGTMVCQ